MRQVFTLLLFISFITTSQAQNTFLPGSITVKNGATQDALIKYNAWQYSPDKISYKLASSEETLTGNLETLDAFSIEGKVQYRAADVKIDVSSNIAKQVSNSREPKWEDQRIFLKEVIGTGVKLYFYKTSQYERFFYQKINEADYTQLVYKPYVSVQSYKSYNQDFRKQIKDNFVCDGLDTDYRKLEYKYKSIANFFAAYNGCLGYETSSINTSKPKPPTYFNLKGGLSVVNGNFVKLPQQNVNIESFESDYETSGGFILGLGIELVLPYQNNQWSILIDVQFETFSSNGSFSDAIFFLSSPTRSVASSKDWRLNVSHITMGVGVRRSFFMANKDRVYLNAGINSNFAIQLNSTKFIGDVNNQQNPGSLSIDISERNSFYTGLGYASKKFSVEACYSLPREVLSDRTYFKSKYRSLALIFGYRFER